MRADMRPDGVARSYSPDCTVATFVPVDSISAMKSSSSAGDR